MGNQNTFVNSDYSTIVLQRMSKWCVLNYNDLNYNVRRREKEMSSRVRIATKSPLDREIQQVKQSLRLIKSHEVVIEVIV